MEAVDQTLYLSLDQSPEEVRLMLLQAIEKSNVLFDTSSTESFTQMGKLLGVNAEDAQLYFYELCRLVYAVVGRVLLSRKEHAPLTDDVFFDAVSLLKNEYGLEISSQMVKSLNSEQRHKVVAEIGFKEF